MDQPENKKQLFREWKRDYAKVDSAEQLKYFSFTPKNDISTERDFTDELCRFGTEQDINLVITKEGMYPEFRIDDIEYMAHREHRNMPYSPVPVEIVLCEAVHPELLEAEVPVFKRKVIQFTRRWWWFMLLILVPDWVYLIRTGAPFWFIPVSTVFEIALMAAFLWPYRNHRN